MSQLNPLRRVLWIDLPWYFQHGPRSTTRGPTGCDVDHVDGFTLASAGQIAAGLPSLRLAKRNQQLHRPYR